MNKLNDVSFDTQECRLIDCYKVQLATRGTSKKTIQEKISINFNTAHIGLISHNRHWIGSSLAMLSFLDRLVHSDWKKFWWTFFSGGQVAQVHNAGDSLWFLLQKNMMRSINLVLSEWPWCQQAAVAARLVCWRSKRTARALDWPIPPLRLTIL